jgi:hypothetical protein
MKIPIFLKASERSFDGSHPTIRAAFNNGSDAPKPRGQHSAMSAECESDSFNWIRNNWEKSNPITRTDIRHHF